MHNHNYGAHELMEFQDVLTNTITNINMFQLFLQSVQDFSLRQIVLQQVHFMTQEYNQMVHFSHGLGTGQTPAYRTPVVVAEHPGENELTSKHPHAENENMNDHEIALCLLTLHKAGATMRMHAALECTDQQIRQFIQQGANNCAHQAYEIWNYLHTREQYPVPSLQDLSEHHPLHGFQAQRESVTDQTIFPTNSHQPVTQQTPYSESVYSSGFETSNMSGTETQLS